MNTSDPTRRHVTPWNRGKVVGQEAPRKSRDVGALPVDRGGSMHGRGASGLANVALRLGAMKGAKLVAVRVAHVGEIEDTGGT